MLLRPGDDRRPSSRSMCGCHSTVCRFPHSRAAGDVSTAAAEASDKRMNWPFSKKKSFFFSLFLLITPQRKPGKVYPISKQLFGQQLPLGGAAGSVFGGY